MFCVRWGGGGGGGGGVRCQVHVLRTSGGGGSVRYMFHERRGGGGCGVRFMFCVRRREGGQSGTCSTNVGGGSGSCSTNLGGGGSGSCSAYVGGRGSGSCSTNVGGGGGGGGQVEVLRAHLIRQLTWTTLKALVTQAVQHIRVIYHLELSIVVYEGSGAACHTLSSGVEISAALRGLGGCYDYIII